MSAHDPRDDALTERLRRALAEEADQMSIDPGGLDAIRTRTERPERPGWTWQRSVGGLAAAAAVATIGVVVWNGQSPDDLVGTAPAPTPTSSPAPTPVTTASPTPRPTTSPQPTPPAGQRLVVPVYFVQQTPRGLRLDREFHTVTGTGAGEAALAEMLAGRSQDPSSDSSWNPDTRVLGVTTGGGQITVDLSAEATRANVGSESAELAVQQLVYTVTAALQSDLPVRLEIDGEPVSELWGHVGTDQPLRRADPLDVRKLVQINDPTFGAETGRQVTVTGEAAVFEATLPWQLLDADGRIVDSGVAMTTEGQRFAPFSFDLPPLQPGSYTVVITEDDPSGGEGGPPMTDAHDVTVR